MCKLTVNKVHVWNHEVGTAMLSDVDRVLYGEKVEMFIISRTRDKKSETLMAIVPYLLLECAPWTFVQAPVVQRADRTL